MFTSSQARKRALSVVCSANMVDPVRPSFKEERARSLERVRVMQARRRDRAFGQISGP